MKTTGPTVDYKSKIILTYVCTHTRDHIGWCQVERAYILPSLRYTNKRKFLPCNKIRCTIINRTNDGNCEHTHTDRHTCVNLTRANFLPTICVAYKKFSNPFTHGETNDGWDDGDDDNEQNRTNTILNKTVIR